MQNLSIKSKLIFSILFVLFGFQAYGQVTVGSLGDPGKASLLDLKTKEATDGGVTSERGGLLFPRVAIDDVNSLNVFDGLSDTDINTDEQKRIHIGLTVYNVADNADVDPGIYVWNGSQWRKSSFNNRVNFFYMPSFAINTSTTGVQDFDLYNIYMQQFDSPKASSAGAPADIPFYIDPEDLYYYVTDYDTDVFTVNSIDARGNMNVTINKAAVDTTFMNIVFIIK